MLAAVRPIHRIHCDVAFGAQLPFALYRSYKGSSAVGSSGINAQAVFASIACCTFGTEISRSYLWTIFVALMPAGHCAWGAFFHFHATAFATSASAVAIIFISHTRMHQYSGTWNGVHIGNTPTVQWLIKLFCTPSLILKA